MLLVSFSGRGAGREEAADRGSCGPHPAPQTNGTEQGDGSCRLEKSVATTRRETGCLGEGRGREASGGPAPPRTGAPKPSRGRNGPLLGPKKVFLLLPPGDISKSFIFLATLAKKQKGTID